MEYWNRLVALLSQRMDTFGFSATDIPVPLVTAALLFPLLLTALARQPLAFFSVLLVICGLLAIDPATAQAGALVAIGAYISSILIGVIAIQWTIRNRRIGAELARLRASVEHLRRIVEAQAIQAEAAAEPQAARAAPSAAVAAAAPATTAAPAIIEAETQTEPPTATPGEVAAPQENTQVADAVVPEPAQPEPAQPEPARPEPELIPPDEPLPIEPRPIEPRPDTPPDMPRPDRPTDRS